jgi:hypothetical protein
MFPMGNNWVHIMGVVQHLLGGEFFVGLHITVLLSYQACISTSTMKNPNAKPCADVPVAGSQDAS